MIITVGVNLFGAPVGYAGAHRLTNQAVADQPAAPITDANGNPVQDRVVALDGATFEYWWSGWTGPEGLFEARGLPPLAPGQTLLVVGTPVDPAQELDVAAAAGWLQVPDDAP